MIDFLIFYETKNREFESIVLLGLELKKRGYSVEFFSFFSDRSFSKCKKYFNNVKIAVMPSMYHEEELLKIIYMVAGKVENIINLRWEQVYTNATEMNLDYYIYPKGLAKEAYNCCWGVMPKKLLVNSGVAEDKIKITGPIHMDFLKPKFKGFYLDKCELFKKYKIPFDKNTILFISSFSVSTMEEEKINSYLLQYNEHERKQFENFVNVERKTRSKVVDWLIRLSSDRNCTIIYRPHPTELETDEIKKLYKMNNIKVIGEENVKQWILTCDEIYTWYSTSYAEGYFSNKNINVLRPVKIDYNDELSIYNGVDTINSYENLLLCYDEVIKNNSRHDVNPNIDLYYTNNTYEYNYKNVVNYFESIYNLNSKFPWGRIRIFDYIKLYFFSIKTDIANWFYLKFANNNLNNKLFRFIFKPYLQKIKYVLEHRKIDAKQIISDFEFKNLMNMMEKYLD